MRRQLRINLFMLLLCFWFSVWLRAVPGQAQDAVVRAVLFYSPTCGHCHYVITEALPPLFEQYGEQLEIVVIDTTNREGAHLFQAAIERFEIPPEAQAVPMLIIEEIILLGSVDIPERFPGLIEQYLARGGVDWPDIPGLQNALDAFEPKPTAAPETTPAAPQADRTEETGEPAATREAAPEPSPTAMSTGSILTEDTDPGIGERFSRDPLGNSLAIVILFGMLVSIFVAFKKLWPAAAMSRRIRPSIWIPVFCLAGMFVAGYLAYVETAKVEAMCGPVGDCNTVQQSEYARLFGVLPIGVLGLAGYIAILTAWLLSRYGSKRLASLASLALLGLALFGVAFSVYLTFLEPFVIGATCAWCLTSSVIMTLLLLLSIEPGRWALSHDIFAS